MASTTSTQRVTLGAMAAARGEFGPRLTKATTEQVQTADRILRDRSSYSTDLENCVICVDDRLSLDGIRKQAPHLAGGALALGLMYHLLYGGQKLSACLRELKRLGFYMVLHDDCGALKLAPTLVPERLSNREAEGYKILDGLGIKVDAELRERIAIWAATMPEEFFDAEECLKIVDEVEPTVGEHNAVAVAVSLQDGESFVAGPELGVQTQGLRAFAFDPWVAKRAGIRMGVALEESLAAERLGQLFTAEVLLQLAAADLDIVVHE